MKGDMRDGHAPRGARRAGDADRARRRRGVVDGLGRERRGSRLRLGAARQRRDGAPLPGSDRPLLAARRAQPDPLHPRRGRGRTVERAARTGEGRRLRRAHRRCERIPSADTGLSPLEIWCNEAQERYVLAVDAADLDRFAAICERERCPFAVVGEATAEPHLRARRRPLTARSRWTCRCRCCSASRRACTASSRAWRPRPCRSRWATWISRTPSSACCACRRWRARASWSRSAIAASPGMVQPRPDGRPLAGAGGRCRHHDHQLRHLRGRGDGDGRAHAARADRRRRLGAHGGGRGADQHRLGADRAARPT